MNFRLTFSVVALLSRHRKSVTRQAAREFRLGGGLYDRHDW